MQFLKLSLQNFMSVKTLIEVNLDSEGLVLLEGNNTLISYGNSNGAGKSVIPEGIRWVLTGTTERGEQADEVINEDMFESTRFPCVGTLTWKDDGRKYEAVRTRRPTGFRIVRDDGFILPDPEGYVKAHLGTKELIDIAILFSTKLSELSDTTKKQLFESMLGIGWIDPALVETKKTLSAVEVQVSGFTNTLSILSESLQNKQRELLELEAMSSQWYVSTRVKLEYLIEQKRIAEKEIRSASTSVDSETREIMQFDSEIVSNTEYLREVRKKQVAKNAEINKELTILSSTISVLVSNSITLQAKIKNLSELRGAVCPTCARPIPAGEATDIIYKMQSELEQIMADVVTQNKHKDSCEEESRKIRHDLESSVTSLESLITLAQKTRDLHLQKRAEYGLVLATNKTLYDSFEKQMSEISNSNPYKDLMEKCSQAIEKQQASISEETEKLDGGKMLVEIFEFYEWLFGRTGIRSFVSDSVINRLNEVANEFSKEVSDGMIRVQFSPTEILKGGGTRERFTSMVKNLTGSKLLKGNSDGEQNRISMIEALSMNALARARLPGGINLAIFDEVFDGLDEVGMYKAIQVLNSLAAKLGTVIVITHQPNLKQFFGKVWTMYRDREGSRLQ